MKQVLVFRHIPHEGLGTVQKFLQSFEIQIHYCDMYQDHSVPDIVEDFDYVISMGGPMNVDETDRYPFLENEKRFISQAISLNKRVLGICLGAQIIARALGARVYAGPRKEIGWFPIQLSESGTQDAIFKKLEQKEWIVFHWHGDTFDLPEGAVHLASSNLYQNQAYRFNNAYGFQFHIEITPELIQEWLEKGAGELTKVKHTSARKISHETQKYMPSLAPVADKIYHGLFSNLFS